MAQALTELEKMKEELEKVQGQLKAADAKLAKVKATLTDVHNPLVLLIAVHKYNKKKGWPDLPGVIKDHADWTDLFENKYNYDVVRHGTIKDKKISKTKVWKLIQKARAELEKHAVSEDDDDDDGKKDGDEKKDKYDGLIVVICGHGDEGLFICSDLQQIPLDEIFKEFKGILKSQPMFVKCARVFIIDACRGPDTAEAREKMEKERALITARGDAVSQWANFASGQMAVFATVKKLMALETTEGGGFLSSKFIKELSSDIGERSFSVVLRQVKEGVAGDSEGQMAVENTSTLVDDFIWKPRKAAPSSDK